MRTFAPVLLALAVGSAIAQSQDGAPECTIVFSQGRNGSSTDPKVNEMWNGLNDAFNQFVSNELSASGRRVVRLPHPVEARETQANIERIMKRARSEGCTTLVDVAMFADQKNQLFVSRMRVHPIIVRKVAEPAPGTDYSVGAEVFSEQQQDPLSRETLDRLVPSEIANRLVSAYVSKSTK